MADNDDEVLTSLAGTNQGELSNQDKIGLALIALASPLIGQAMGGRVGGYAGAAAGATAVGGALKDHDAANAKIAAAQAAEVKRKQLRDQDMQDFEKKETFKANIKPAPKAGTRAVTTRNPDGTETIEIVPDVAGAKYESAAKPDKPAKDTSVVDPKENRGALERAARSYRVDARKYQAAIDGAKEAETLATMAKTNPRAAGAVVGKLARAAGEVGVLSDADIQRLGGAQSLQQRLERFVGLSTSDQKITDEDIRFAQELARTMGVSAEANLEGLANSAVGSHTSIFGGDEDATYNQITGRKRKANAAPVAPATAPAVTPDKDPDAMSEAELDAEIARMKGPSK